METEGAEESTPPLDASVDAAVQSMLEEAREDVAHADQRASMIIAAVGIGVSVALTGLLSGGIRVDRLAPAEAVVWFVGGALAIISVIGAAVAVWPDHRVPSGSSITGWKHLAGVTTPAQLTAAVRRRGAVGSDRAGRELIALSATLRRKYAAMQVSLLFAGASGLALAAAAFQIF